MLQAQDWEPVFLLLKHRKGPRSEPEVQISSLDLKSIFNVCETFFLGVKKAAGLGSKACGSIAETLFSVLKERMAEIWMNETQEGY